MRFLILILAFCLISTSSADAAKRLALIIGNDAYEHVPKLGKARGDAEAMARSVTALGFETVTAFDANRREMNRTITQFTTRLEPGDTALVFFAGHGVEIVGENHLLPTDIAPSESGNADFIRFESIALSALLNRIQSTGARTTLVFLDACRDNPFAASSLGRSIGGTRGLARITAPEGTFIVYSAGAGQQALDGLSPDDPNPNSVFTRLLLPKLNRPGLELRNLVSELRVEVRDLARTRSHAQFPAYYDELLGQFYFNENQAEPATTEETAQQADGDIHKDFELARSINSADAYRLFLGRYGTQTDSVAVGLARQLLANLEGNAPDGTAQTRPLATPLLEPQEPQAPETTGRQLLIDEAVHKREITRRTQAALNARGCQAGPADGIIGRRTLSALDQFLTETGITLSNGSIGSETALNAILATSGTICKPTPVAAKKETAPKPKAPVKTAEPKPTAKPAAAAKPVTFSLTGNWTGKSSCVTGQLRIRYRQLSPGKYRETAKLASDSGRSSGTVTVSGRNLTARINLPEGSKNPAAYPSRWSAKLSANGKSFTGTDSKGCKITRTKVGG